MVNDNIKFISILNKWKINRAEFENSESSLHHSDKNNAKMQMFNEIISDLGRIKRTSGYQLPFGYIDPSSNVFCVIDCFLSTHDIPLARRDISEITNLPLNDINPILSKLLNQKIIKSEKDSNGIVIFSANFASPKTMGLYQYYRAVLAENLEKMMVNEKPKEEEDEENNDI